MIQSSLLWARFYWVLDKLMKYGATVMAALKIEK